MCNCSVSLKLLFRVEKRKIMWLMSVFLLYDCYGLYVVSQDSSVDMVTMVQAG